MPFISPALPPFLLSSQQPFPTFLSFMFSVLLKNLSSLIPFPPVSSRTLGQLWLRPRTKKENPCWTSRGWVKSWACSPRSIPSTATSSLSWRNASASGEKHQRYLLLVVLQRSWSPVFINIQMLHGCIVKRSALWSVFCPVEMISSLTGS